MTYIPLDCLPDLTQEEIASRKWYASMYEDVWHEQEIPSFGIHKSISHEAFSDWFVKNCEGHWALPSEHSLLFTHEVDKLKFIMRWL